MEHTKEPWRIVGFTDIYSGSMTVAATGKGDDAIRIVACVNACRGIPTGLLEKDVNGQIVHMRETMQQRDEQRDRANFYESLNGKQADMLSDVIRQRDELLAALEKLCEAADDSDGCQYGTLATHFVRDIARAAISKVKP